jgi:hypothetical protein
MLIYVAGPLSSPDPKVQSLNVQAAKRAARAVWRRGHQPLVPHLTVYLDHYWQKRYGDVVPYETWMTWALELVSRCDALLYLGPSPGADRELAMAWERGKVIYRRVDEIPARTDSAA